MKDKVIPFPALPNPEIVTNYAEWRALLTPEEWAQIDPDTQQVIIKFHQLLIDLAERTKHARDAQK